MVTLVFLHGIGDGGIEGAWQTAVERSLASLGYPNLESSQVIAPRYAGALKQHPPPTAKMPKVTASRLGGVEEARERWAYERRQAALERMVGGQRLQGRLAELPEMFEPLGLKLLSEAQRYVANEGLRACILHTVLDRLPLSGEVVLVGHSLGSLVAIDILDHLPPNLVVRRLVTLGSPAGRVVMHGQSNRLLKEFPWKRVQSWLNVTAAGDIIPVGKGIAHLFPQALDIGIKVRGSLWEQHIAETYLAHPSVAMAVGEGLFGPQTRDVVPACRTVDRPLDQSEAMIMAALAYGHCLGDEIQNDEARRARFRAALDSVQRGLIAALGEVYQKDGLGLPVRLALLAEGGRPAPGALVDVENSVPVLLEIAAGNVIEPYEIDVPEDKRKRAFERLAVFLEYRSDRGKIVFEALAEARKIVHGAGVPWIAYILGGGLLALVGPIGLMMAAPAGLAGGAAIVSALAAFGPGGMVGGLLTAGVFATAGAGTAGAGLAKALAGGGTSSEAFRAVVVRQLAAVIARLKLKDPRDDTPWFVLCTLEAEVAREIQRLEPYSDKNAPTLVEARAKADIVRNALHWMREHFLVPMSLAAP